MAWTMPIALTGPSARLLVRSLMSRAGSPSATVAALAVIAPKDVRSAARVAAKRSRLPARRARLRLSATALVRKEPRCFPVGSATFCCLPMT